MPHLEIEKRYLIKSDSIKKILENNFIDYRVLDMEQFYLVANIDETLRYRKEGRIYVKNSKRGSGLVREETQKRVSHKKYLNAKLQNSGGIIKKQRLIFDANDYTFELDIFKGALRGLRILEVEFPDVQSAQLFKMPQLLEPLIIKEITNETIYSNGALSQSMQVPLRADSYISLKEFRQAKEFDCVDYNLYISEYENTKLALDNSLKALFGVFEYQIEEFMKNKSIVHLKVANRALSHYRSLIKSYEHYIKSASYNCILLNIDVFLHLFEEILQLHSSFVQLLKRKEKFDFNMQTKVLKLLIDIAKKQKRKKDKLLKSQVPKMFKELKRVTGTISYSSSLNKPFEYINHKLIKEKRLGLKKSLKKEKNIEAVFLNLKEYKHLLQFSKQDDKLVRYSTLKKFVQKERSKQIITSFNAHTGALFNRYSNAKKKIKSTLKIIQKGFQ